MTRFLLGLKIEMSCLPTTALLLEPTVILQVKVCDSAKSLSSISLTTEIFSVETWDFVLWSNVPFIIVKPSVLVVGGVQTTSVIWAGMSEKVQLMTWSFTVYTTAVAGCIVAPGNKCCRKYFRTYKIMIWSYHNITIAANRPIRDRRI